MPLVLESVYALRGNRPCSSPGIHRRGDKQHRREDRAAGRRRDEAPLHRRRQRGAKREARDDHVTHTGLPACKMPAAIRAAGDAHLADGEVVGPAVPLYASDTASATSA